MMRQEQFYVAASRGRDGIMVITSNVDQLRESLGISTARPSATELAREQAQIHPGQEHGLTHPAIQKIDPPSIQNEIGLGHDRDEPLKKLILNLAIKYSPTAHQSATEDGIHVPSARMRRTFSDGVE